MKTVYLSVALVILWFHPARSQTVGNINASGSVIDSSGNALASSTVVLLNPKDSVMVSFAITNNEGRFSLKRLSAGDYLLQVSYLGYIPKNIPVTIQQEEREQDLGQITLQPVTSALDEVLVKAERIPMEINKDTIAYNAAAFKTKPNDVVEDLLKKLPGIEVESDGTIKAQGEEVKQVLVDGKEFFGKDPQIATKNLPASAVNKVQVFDKKSDMAEFTGIDDGQDEKAINIELKEDHKKGIFGNIEGGYGTNDRYESKINLNKFSKNQQISLLGMANNVNRQGFSMNDYVSFAGGLGNLMRSGGGMVRINNSSTNGVPISDGLSNGFVNTGAGGINFNQEFSKNTKLNLSYFYSGIRNEIDQLINRESILAESSFLSEENDNEISVNGNHRINATFDHKLDSMQNIRVRTTLAFNDSEYSILSNSRTINDLGILENTGLRDNNSNGNNTNFTTEIIYRKKFSKKGRNMTASAEFGKSRDDQMALLQSTNQFVGENSPSTTEIINQDHTQNNKAVNYGLELTYTEPLGKNNFLNLGYSRKNYSNQLLKDVYDLDPLGTGVFNDLLSNHYNRDYVYDRGSTSWRWIKNKSNLQIGVDAQKSLLQGQFFTSEDMNIEKSYFNILPEMSWNYDLARSKSLRFTYNTSVREPSLTQLQPIVDNSNPLSIYIGNPDLRPEYSHQIRLRYFSFSQFSMTNFFAMVNANYTDNAIVNARTIDNQFRQTTTPVNVDNDYRISTFTGVGTPLRFIKARINMHGNFTYNRGIVFINTVEENTRRYSSSIDLSFDNQKKDILDFRIGTNIRHSLTKYSVSDQMDQDYFNQSYYTDISINLKDSWSIATRFDYNFYQTLGDNRSIPIWRASVSKYLLKRKGELKLSAFDLLNQNIGIQQNIDLNYIEDVRINSLARYFMLSFTYAINQMIGQSDMPGGGFHMMRRGG
ncbi:MAG: outer membrane beta-barrel protein [Saprospiraceae bacterium]|nr:outer membrane beta-barrel protein [Saprospiraceae bacterium]